MTGGPRAPLVSIGIPTYERVGSLRRALASALAQMHSPLEVVVSDNGSRDGTEELCRDAAARDARIRYLRQAENRGSTANFNELFQACRGDYILLLADDDWLDPNYVAVCLATMRGGSSALVGGWSRYERNGEFVRDGVIHEHCQGDAPERVRDYLRSVDDNGIFHGLIPRSVLERAKPLPNTLGNDWLYVARIAYLGRIRTLRDVRIHREVGGTSTSIASVVAQLGLTSREANAPQLAIAWELLRDIGWSHSVYRPLGRRRRVALGLQAALASMRWRALAWHLVTPRVQRLAARRRGRHVWTLYDRLTRALGAGRHR